MHAASALLPTQAPLPTGGTLLLVSGPEGSGTTMLQRVLCESDATLCFFTSPSASARGLSNTQLLSPRAQRKYAALGDTTSAAQEAFDEATRALWWDGATAYAENDADTRPPSQREAKIRAAGAAACDVLKQSAAAGLNITSLAIHRSIPYGGGGGDGWGMPTDGGMPHLEDLPDLAREIGACLGGVCRRHPYGARPLESIRYFQPAVHPASNPDPHVHISSHHASAPRVQAGRRRIVTVAIVVGRALGVRAAVDAGRVDVARPHGLGQRDAPARRAPYAAAHAAPVARR